MQMSFEKRGFQLYIEGVRLNRLLRILRLFVDIPEVIPDLQFCRSGLENLRQAIDRERIFFLLSMDEGHTELCIPVCWIVRNQLLQFFLRRWIVLGLYVEAHELMPDVTISRIHILQIFLEYFGSLFLVIPRLVH